MIKKKLEEKDIRIGINLLCKVLPEIGFKYKSVGESRSFGCQSSSSHTGKVIIFLILFLSATSLNDTSVHHSKCFEV